MMMMMKPLWILEFLIVTVFLSYHSTVIALANTSNATVGDPPDYYYMECKASDVGLAQAAGDPLPNGIPTFLVEIFSTCESCGISHVHVSCGAFASVNTVNPKVFRRVAFGDCLVNDGQPIKSGQIFSFTYANSFMYPMKVASVSIC